jgi:CDP-diacylglycerol--serine O-phosphatidyltransferase
MTMQPQEPRRVVRDLPLTRLLPNMLTLMALCSGLTAMRYAMQAKWENAVLAIVLAGIFDMLDGRMARFLNITSKFGAELDSLADAISFGVAPGFVVYEWTLKDIDRFGWIAVLLYAVCMVLRLARFNVMLDDASPARPKNYFTGVPAPGGAGLAILPIVAVLQFGDAAEIPPVATAFWLLFIAGLLVSRLPTLALKGWRVTPVWVVPIFIGLVALVALAITNTFLALFCVCMAYLFSLPIGWYTYRHRMKREGLLK